MSSRTSIEAIDLEIMGDLARYVPLIESVNRRMRRVYALGAMAALACALLVPIAVSMRAEASALQLVLLGFVSLIVALGALRALADRVGVRLRAEVETVCSSDAVSPLSIAQLALRRRDHWPFARSVLAPLSKQTQKGNGERASVEGGHQDGAA